MSTSVVTTGPAARRDRLRSAFDGIDALLVTNASNVRYLTGFTGSNGAVLVAAESDADRLLTDFRYLTQSQTECPDIETLISKRLPRSATEYARDLGASRLGIEAAHLSVATHADLTRDVPGISLEPTEGLVEALRTTKEPDELAAITTACRQSDEALALLLHEVRVGMSERAIARRLEWLMLEVGADAISFETIVAGGPHSAIPHHQPTDRPLEAGDLLKIDFGALYAGYHADETRTFVVGAEPAEWQRDLHALVAEAQRAGIAALAVGASLAEVDAAARSVIADAGFGEQFGHGLGHGVGLDIHEVPFFAAESAGILSDRTPVTVEPGVYLPGRGGVRIEDTLEVTTGGPVSLTTTTRELLVL